VSPDEQRTFVVAVITLVISSGIVATSAGTSGLHLLHELY
jgi:hypothetical protein